MPDMFAPPRAVLNSFQPYIHPSRMFGGCQADARRMSSNNTWIGLPPG